MLVRRLLGAGIVFVIAAAAAVAHSETASADTAPAAAASAAAPAPGAPAAAPTIEQRLANLEAYVTNGAPDANGGALAATSGPGHNGWMMISTALVLFMTLPC